MRRERRLWKARDALVVRARVPHGGREDSGQGSSKAGSCQGGAAGFPGPGRRLRSPPPRSARCCALAVAPARAAPSNAPRRVFPFFAFIHPQPRRARLGPCTRPTACAAQAAGEGPNSGSAERWGLPLTHPKSLQQTPPHRPHFRKHVRQNTSHKTRPAPKGF